MSRFSLPALALLLSAASLPAAPPPTILVGAKGDSVETYAAQELAKYLFDLWGIKAAIVTGRREATGGPEILLGNPSDNPRMAEFGQKLKWGDLRDDGFYLKTVQTDPDVLVVGGRLPRATLFGVYELVERWGMRFSLTEDIFPSHPPPMRLSSFDEKCEPAYAIRALRPCNNLTEGSTAWSLAEFGRFIDQLAKLKYNTYNFDIMESGPWLDYEFRGMKRPAGDIFYGWRYPIGDDFVGKELFPHRTEFYSPILGKARNGEERKQLGIGLVRYVIARCHRRGLMTMLNFPFLEPPTEFKHKMNDWATLPLPDPRRFAGAIFNQTPVEEFGTNPKYAAWMNILDPAVQELVETRLRALVDTYPEADFYHLWVSEHRAAVVDYQEIFRVLDERHHFDRGFDLDRALDHPGTYPYGLSRYQNQIKGDLLYLFMFDQAVAVDAVLNRTAKPSAQLDMVGVMPELWPLVLKILPPGMAYSAFLEYGTHATADRVADLAPVARAGVPTTLELGIQDDNTMYFPQVNLQSLERIVRATAPLALRGFVATLWQPRQTDINAAYLARAAWEPDLSSARFYRDYLPALVGPRAAADFRLAEESLEKTDAEVKKSLYGFAFAFPTVFPKALDGVRREAIRRIRPQFESAASILRRARAEADPAGQARIDFWLKRTEFAIAWLDLSRELADLGAALGSARQAPAPLTAEQKQAGEVSVDRLIAHARDLIRIIATDAKSTSDLGEIASLNSYVLEYLKGLRADLEARPVRG